ncbi:DNA topoisomerase 3-alpha, partial [Bienertia sinuspersici]
SSGSGSSSLCRGSYPQLYYFYNKVALLRVVRHVGPHQGKRFYGCSYFPRTCGFFKWEDEIDDIREMQQLMFEKDVKIAEWELHKSELEMKRQDWNCNLLRLVGNWLWLSFCL